MQDKTPLLRSTRFLPLFVTQFLSAFNDNVFKQAILLLLAIQATSTSESALYANLAAGLFILPFFLFSGLAGQLAEGKAKHKLIRLIKFCEIPIMGIGSAAILLDNTTVMLTAVFFMGLQSTFFGPLKYSILPQHVESRSLTKANGLIESATFIAILLGTVFGTYFIDQTNGKLIICGIVILIATVGFVASLRIPLARPNNRDQNITLNPIKSTIDVFQALRAQTPAVNKSVLGISWFWLTGAIILTALPTYVMNELGGEALDVTLALVIFSLSIAIGSLLCEKLSRSRVELGLVPFGAFLITLFLFMLSQVDTYHADMAESVATSNMYDAFMWMALTGIAAGLYTVPLYTLIQQRTEDEARARIIAANNVMNSLFMVLSAVLSIVVLSVLKLSIGTLFLLVSVLNLLVAIYIYTKVPEFFMRFVIYIISHIMYRMKTYNAENIPDEGPAMLAANHVSFIDWMLILSASPRPVRFVIYEPIYNSIWLHWLFKAAKAIPIDSAKKNMQAFLASTSEIAKALENGELICIFPEGKLTSDGEIDQFKRGIEMFIKKTAVPVVPIRLNGLWGSMFSRKNKWRLPRLRWSAIEVIVGEPITPNNVTAVSVEEKVKSLKKGA